MPLKQSVRRVIEALAICSPCSVAFAADLTAVVREAVTLRALAIEAPAAVQPLLDSMPLGAMGREAVRVKTRQLAWSFFFGGTLLKLGQVDSSAPLALHYNPILDVAVLQGCQTASSGKQARCVDLCAMPGEVLGRLHPLPAPEWMGETNPLEALARTASSRVGAFARERPAEGKAGPAWKPRYCSRANQQVAELRIMQGLASLSNVDPSALEAAVAEFNSRPAGAGSGSGREVRTVLSNLPALVLSGVVALPNGGWCLTLTPKRTGWRQVVLIVGLGASGALRLESARILSIQTEVKP